MRFKNLKGKPERESSKRIISTSGGLGLLQMVSKSNIGWCASKDAEPQRGQIPGGGPVRTLGPEGGGL